MEKIEAVKNEINNSDFVFCLMDEPPYIAQRIVNRACYELKIDSMYCFSQNTAGKLFFVSPDKSACVDCLLACYDSEDFQFLAKTFVNNSADLITANIKSNITMLCSWVVKKW